jgi:hypothetical protein
MKKQTMYECFRCRERHSTENVSPTCAKCVYDQKFEIQNTIFEQGRIIDRLRAQVMELEDWQMRARVSCWKEHFRSNTAAANDGKPR